MQRNRLNDPSKRDDAARRRRRGGAWLRAMAFGAALAGSPAWALEPSEDQVTLNFKNADIRSVVELVSKVTGRNFVLDPRVKGNVTVVSTAPVPPEVVYETFLSILAVHGFSAMPDGGGLVRIVPDNAAVASAGFSEDVYAEEVLDGEMRISVIPIRNVDAGQLVPLLRPLVDKNGHLVAHPQSNALIVADSARAIERLRRVIEVMDRVNDGDLSFFPLRYAVASKVMTTLQPLIAGTVKGGANKQVTLAADDRTNTLMVSGGEGPLLERLRLLIAHLDAPTDNAGDTRVIYLNYAKAADAAEVLRKLADDMHQQSGEAKSGGGSMIGIQADPGTNSLLVTAKPDDMRTLLSAVEAMDIRRAQVLVETLIVEVTDEKARKLGIQWVAAQDALLSLTDASALSSSALDLGTLIGRIGMGAGVNIGFLARALANDANANIISTPSLITMDNAEAEINVGREVPFVTGSYTSTGDSTNPSNPFTTIQRSNVGLTLKITPQINKGAVIRMDIDQEVSSLLPGAAATFGATDVVTSVRSLKTSVVVEDGEMLVLGGLVDDNLSENQVRIPLFGDLPIFGPLFRYREMTKEKRNLLIFIRPRILRDAATNRTLSQRKYKDIRALQIERQSGGVDLLPNGAQPVLDPLTQSPAAVPVPPASETVPSPVSAPIPKAAPEATLETVTAGEGSRAVVEPIDEEVEPVLRKPAPSPVSVVPPEPKLAPKPVSEPSPEPRRDAPSNRGGVFPDEFPYMSGSAAPAPTASELNWPSWPSWFSSEPSESEKQSETKRQSAERSVEPPARDQDRIVRQASLPEPERQPEIEQNQAARPVGVPVQNEPASAPQPLPESDIPPAPDWGPITLSESPKPSVGTAPIKKKPVKDKKELELKPMTLSPLRKSAVPPAPDWGPVPATQRPPAKATAENKNEIQLKPLSPLPPQTSVVPSAPRWGAVKNRSKRPADHPNGKRAALELKPLSPPVAAVPSAPEEGSAERPVGNPTGYEGASVRKPSPPASVVLPVRKQDLADDDSTIAPARRDSTVRPFWEEEPLAEASATPSQGSAVLPEPKASEPEQSDPPAEPEPPSVSTAPEWDAGVERATRIANPFWDEPAPASKATLPSWLRKVLPRKSSDAAADRSFSDGD